MNDREIMHRFQVQPGLSVAVEDSLNILLEITRHDGSEVIVRSDVLSNIDDLKTALDLARVWVAGAKDDADSRRYALQERVMPRRYPRSPR